VIPVPLTLLIFLPFLFAGVVFVWAHLRMVLHETAHYLAARAVSFNPLQMEWGTSEKGWRFHLLGVPVVWHLQPWNGITHCQPTSLEGFCWRGAVCVLAGIVVDVLLLLLIAWVNRHAEATYTEPPLWYWITKPLVFAQSVILMFTLLPMDLQIEEWKSCTDGKQLLKHLSGRSIRDTRTGLEEYLAVVRRYQPGFTFEESWLYRPDPELVRLHHRAVAAAREGKLKEALANAETVLARASMAPGERAMLLDNMAAAAGLQGKRWDLERALAWAREAHALLPAARPVHATLGGLLVESGELTEAVILLEPLTAPENEPEVRIQACCYLAKVCNQLNDRNEARQWMEKARAIQPDHPLVMQMDAELGATAVEA